MNQELIEKATERYGSVVVSEVLEMADLTHADCMYITYDERGMDEHAECTKSIFFPVKYS
jgi:hypothetical protein